MALTLTEAMTALRFHMTETWDGKPLPCGGPRSNRWRRNGATQTWKREPGRFSIPVKYGLRDYGRIENADAHRFHDANACPDGAY